MFEKYKLDYCCRGKRSLHQACTENNVPVNIVLKALEHIYAVRKNELDFNRIKLYQLTDYIIYTHHSYVKKETPQILSCLKKVMLQHDQSDCDLSKIYSLFLNMSTEICLHMQHEERVVFPQIKELERRSFGTIPIDQNISGYLQIPVVSREHDNTNARKTIAEIRESANNYIAPESSCAIFKLLFKSLQAFETDLHQHLHLENNILFPKALILEKEFRLSFLN